MQSETSVNKLINETSPYLLQHATNPVNWYPWDAAAIQLARQQDKPILLSIGYSACHWCHVMMHESFEDPEVATTMNRLFINIKVDKEERPDLDKIYQTTYQLLMGRAGGWPLTMFLSPDTLLPYFGGTYFPKASMPEMDMTDFQTLLYRLNDVYYHSKEKIKQQEAHTLAILQAVHQPRASSEMPLSESLRQEAETIMSQEFDPEYGGFGNEAKFPNCPSLDFLLHSQQPLMRHIALTTLNNMAHGGIYDQLAGGFFRYTVDQKWQIPHFEKMLYDNAQLLSLYAYAYKLTDNLFYKQIALETGTWLTTTMQGPTGGFYGAMDADSEQQEGLYYLWDLKDIKNSLTATEFSSINKFYQLDHKANCQHKWHLVINPEAKQPDGKVLNTIKQKLLLQRNLRVTPAIDTKILTSWNGLAIKGLSEAGLLLQHQPFLDLAETTIVFIERHLYLQRQLYATIQSDTPKIAGFLDDYVFVIDGILSFMQNNLQHKFLPFCINLADDLITNFYDQEHGGFFFTAHNAEQLFFRPKPYADDIMPSGNGVACKALLKLGRLLGNANYIAIAKQSINAAQAHLNEAPEIHLSLGLAYELLHSSNQ